MSQLKGIVVRGAIVMPQGMAEMSLCFQSNNLHTLEASCLSVGRDALKPDILGNDDLAALFDAALVRRGKIVAIPAP